MFYLVTTLVLFISLALPPPQEAHPTIPTKPCDSYKNHLTEAQTAIVRLIRAINLKILSANATLQEQNVIIETSRNQSLSQATHSLAVLIHDVILYIEELENRAQSLGANITTCLYQVREIQSVPLAVLDNIGTCSSSELDSVDANVKNALGQLLPYTSVYRSLQQELFGCRITDSVCYRDIVRKSETLQVTIPAEIDVIVARVESLTHENIVVMIGAMPAVAVRHERRKGQEKRSKRPSQLYIGGHWLPPNSPSPTPSPNGPHDDGTDRLPELYICGKLSALQLVVGSILLGAIVLIVGLVQLVPNAADADHRYFFIGAGSALLLLGFVLTAVRCFCMHCALRGSSRVMVIEDPPPAGLPPPLEGVNSIDVLVQRRDTQVTLPSELDSLIGPSNQSIDKENVCSDT